MARILVADDDRFSLDMVRRALETDGHSVVTAEDGGAALELFEAGSEFDLVITDVEMPILGGLELAETILAAKAGQRIIIMSGIADELSRARALLRPTVRLISKPVTLEKIRGEATELLA